MIRRFLAASTVTFACLALGACSTPALAPCPVEAQTTELDMLNLSREWIEAFNAHDAPRLIALYADNAYLTFGADFYPAKDYFKLLEKHPTIHIESPSSALYTFDKDVAFMEREIDISEEINGSRQSRTLKFAMAFHYRDGHWRIYGHVSPEPLWRGS